MTSEVKWSKAHGLAPMGYEALTYVAFIFAILAVAFLVSALAMRGASPPARNAWLRIGLIFAAVAAFLYVALRKR